MYVRLGDHLCSFMLRQHEASGGLQLAKEFVQTLRQRDYTAIRQLSRRYYQLTGSPILKIWTAWFHADMALLINSDKLTDRKIFDLLHEDPSAVDYVAKLAHRAGLHRSDNTLLLGWLYSPVFDLAIDVDACPHAVKRGIRLSMSGVTEDEYRSVYVSSLLQYAESKIFGSIKTDFPDLNDPLQQLQVLALAQTGSEVAYEYLVNNPRCLILPTLDYFCPDAEYSTKHQQWLLMLIRQFHNPFAKFKLLKDPAVTVSILEECFGVEVGGTDREAMLSACASNKAVKQYWLKHCKQLSDSEFQHIFAGVDRSGLFEGLLPPADEYTCFRFFRMQCQKMLRDLTLDQVRQINEQFIRHLHNKNPTDIVALMRKHAEYAQYFEIKLLFMLMQSKGKDQQALQILMDYYAMMPVSDALRATAAFANWYAGITVAEQDVIKVLQLLSRLPRPESQADRDYAKAIIDRLISKCAPRVGIYEVVARTLLAWYGCKADEEPVRSYCQAAARVGDVQAFRVLYPEALKDFHRLYTLVTDGYVAAVVILMGLRAHADKSLAFGAEEVLAQLYAEGHLTQVVRHHYQAYRVDMRARGIELPPLDFVLDGVSSVNVGWQDRLKFHLMNCGADPLLSEIGEGLFSPKIRGIPLASVRCIVADHLHAYALAQSRHDPASLWLKIDRQFQQSVDPSNVRSNLPAPGLLFTRYQRGEPVALSMVWHAVHLGGSHVIKLIFFRINRRYYVAVCNRGLGIDKDTSGIRIYQVAYPDRIDDEAIRKQLIMDTGSGEFINDFDPRGCGIGHLLGLRLVGAVPQSMQRIGDCSIISAYNEIFMYLMIEMLHVGVIRCKASTVLNAEDVKLAGIMVKAFGFKELRQASRLSSAQIIQHSLHGALRLPLKSKHVMTFVGRIISAMTQKVDRQPAAIGRCVDILRTFVKCIQDYSSLSPVWASVCLDHLHKRFGLTEAKPLITADVAVDSDVPRRRLS